MPRIIGVDLDNTIIRYDDLIHQLAVEIELVPAQVRQHKKTLRDLIRCHPDGEQRWEQIQAHIYGEGIVRAQPFDGVLDFLQECRRRGAETFIVSHKTQYAAFSGEMIDLRRSALDWLEHIGLFDRKRFGLDAGRVFFESTRDAKVDRIRTLGCSHFIDDLEEVFAHPRFPMEVERLLFDPQAEAGHTGALRVFTSWKLIGNYLFGDGQRRDGISECA